MEKNQDTHLPIRASLMAVFLCTLFGANAVAIKISLTGVGTFSAVGIRFTFAAITLFLWSKWKATPLQLSRHQFIQIALISLVFFTQMSLFYHGQRITTASHGTLIANILPFVVMVFAHFFLINDRISLKKICGLLLGFSGVFFLIADTAFSPASNLRGDLSIFAAVVLWGCNVTYIKMIIANFHPLQITFYPMIFTIPLFWGSALLWDEKIIFSLSPEIVLALCYQSFVTASFGFLMWNTLIQKYGATLLHSFVFIMPISGVFFGFMLLNEPLSVSLFISITFVCLGLIVINSGKHTP